MNPIFTPTYLFNKSAAVKDPSEYFVINVSSLVTPETFWFTLEPFQFCGSSPGRVLIPVVEPRLSDVPQLPFHSSNPELGSCWAVAGRVAVRPRAATIAVSRLFTFIMLCVDWFKYNYPSRACLRPRTITSRCKFNPYPPNLQNSPSLLMFSYVPYVLMLWNGSLCLYLATPRGLFLGENVVA